MRVQHNIMAMNSYRNYSNNTSALGKNLEKLSSGYRINRAGDDAAGLAISEKMRAQITGLEAAQSNAKSGINLVQTAEGALTEVHDMLNRMVKLADQSANGTYDNETDRANLQKEVAALKSEIDRIADSSNFNGINLLDGSLSGAGSSKITGNGLSTIDLKFSDSQLTTNGFMTAHAAVKEKDVFTLATASTSKKTAEYSITYEDADGNAQNVTVQMKADGDKNITYSLDGGKSWTKAATAAAAADVVDVNAAGTILAKEALKGTGMDELFNISNTAGAVTFEAKTEGAGQGHIVEATTRADNTDTTTKPVASAVTRTLGEDTYNIVDVTKMKQWTASTKTKTNSSNKAEDTVFSVDGKKFAFVTNGELKAARAALGDDVTLVEVANTTADSALSTTDGTNMIKQINAALGYDAATETTSGANGKMNFKPVDKTGATGTGGTGKGLTLQIGDTADDFNQLTVSVGDMHAKALGIGGVDISTQEGGKAAVKMIKEAINTVSSTRGDLGALQNRLDHTIKNLSVMQENIQDAESTIRDTDVAAEMMSYTKNNILVQSAQAMLAQANQVPQGVLQLLQ